MQPTIAQGETISIDWDAYVSTGPKRWDAVASESPLSDSAIWVLRVVGLPGETLDIRTDGIYINGIKEAPPSRLASLAYQLPTKHPGSDPPTSFPHKVSPGNYFVLGDNSSNSLDSRYWGDLDGSKIVGQVVGK